MDNPSGLEEEALAIVSIYGPASFYSLSEPAHLATTATRIEAAALPVYTLKVSLEEPDFDFDPAADDRLQSNLGHATSTATHRNTKELELRVYFPKGYPETNTSAPVHEVVSIYYGTLRLTEAMIQEIDQGLDQCFEPGEVIVFSWIEWLRGFLETLESRIADDDSLHHHHHRNVGEEHEDEDESEDEDVDGEGDDQGDDESQRQASDYFAVEEFSQDHHGLSEFSSSLASLSLHPSASSSDNHSGNHNNHNHNSLRVPRASGVPVFNIQTGQPIIDRKSVFVAHLAAITQPAQVPWMIQQLKQENKKVIKATHNIMAFRVENENGTIAQDNDDDGETAAGSRLLHLMSILDVKNVVVVVSRWYGGIPLSADRFKHINNAARQLLDECGYIKPAAAGDVSSSASTNKKKGKSKKAGKR